MIIALLTITTTNPHYDRTSRQRWLPSSRLLADDGATIPYCNYAVAMMYYTILCSTIPYYSIV